MYRSKITVDNPLIGAVVLAGLCYIIAVLLFLI